LVIIPNICLVSVALAQTITGVAALLKVEDCHPYFSDHSLGHQRSKYICPLLYGTYVTNIVSPFLHEERNYLAVLAFSGLEVAWIDTLGDIGGQKTAEVDRRRQKTAEGDRRRRGARGHMYSIIEALVGESLGLLRMAVRWTI
jgi:hypothetical protein